MRLERSGLNIKDLPQDGISVERYLPQDMTSEILFRLSQELSPLACDGFMRNGVTPELVDDVSNHLAVSDRVTIARNTQDEPIAFITASMKNLLDESRKISLYHLEGIIVRPEYHGTGFSETFLSNDIKDSGATYFGFHTQNGRMRSLGLKVAQINDADSSRFACAINTNKQEGLKDVGRYGTSSLYGDTEKFADSAIADINWRQGDAIICIGPVRNEILEKI